MKDYDKWLREGGEKCFEEKHPEKPERESEFDDEGHY